MTDQFAKVEVEAAELHRNVNILLRSVGTFVSVKASIFLVDPEILQAHTV
jgi:hypothetical protein